MKKIKSSAIYYALFLSVIFALVLGALILFSGFNQNFSLQMEIEEILIDNAASGIAYGQINFKELPANKPVNLRLFDTGVDSVELTKKNWGAFTIIQSTAKHRNKSQTKIALMGAVNKIQQPNLYLVDNGRPVSLCGNARIEGLCYLPKAGLRRAYIEGKSYTGTKMVYGLVKPANKQLPTIKTDFVENVASLTQNIILWSQDVDSINVSFLEEAQHFVSDGFMHLDEMVINGQIILEAKDSIFIGQNATINNAIIKSKIVYIETGFSGTVQIFASEKIIIEEFVQLKYPSVVGLIEEDFPVNRPAEITIAQNSQIIGTVFMLSKKPNFRMLPKLTIETNAEIDGLVYCSGRTQLKGTIKGSLFSQKLYLKTASSAYENHLLDGQILKTLPDNFMAANLLEETTLLKQIAWLQ